MLGAGFAGSMHAHSAMRIEGVQVVAVAALPLDQGAVLAKECGARLTTAEEICAADDIDLVVVATPTHLHAQYATLAAKSGKHVFCEKPLARTLADGEAMVRAADEAGVALAVGHSCDISRNTAAKANVDDGDPAEPRWNAR